MINSVLTIPMEVADFVIKHSNGLYEEFERDSIEDYIEAHIVYGTMMIVREKGEIISVVRWNWTNWNTLRVLDLIIHSKYGNKAVLRDMLIKAKLAMPRLKVITFYRKMPGRLKLSEHTIEQFLGGFHGKR